MYDSATQAIIAQLVKISRTNFVYMSSKVGDYTVPRMGHLVCFTSGMFALGAYPFSIFSPSPPLFCFFCLYLRVRSAIIPSLGWALVCFTGGIYFISKYVYLYLRKQNNFGKFLLLPLLSSFHCFIEHLSFLHYISTACE
jgi:hypothetical protein